MSDEKKVTTKEKNFSVKEKTDINRRHIDNIKRTIFIAFIIMCALPILFCLYLMMRMDSLEDKLDALTDKLANRNQIVTYTAEEENSGFGEDYIMDMEYSASDDIEIDISEPSEYLTLMDEAPEDDVAPATEEISLYEENVTTSESAGIQLSNGKKVYLTFDDGPSIYTDELLDILKENNVKATFFVVYTDNKSLWPTYNRIVEEGHTLAMHSYSHVYDQIYASKEAFIEDVSMIHDFLYEQTGVDCEYYRFPGGSSNTVTDVDIQECMGYLQEEGFTYYDWNSLSGDSVDVSLTPEQLNQNIMSYVRNNADDSIVLLHDLENNYNTIESLQALIDTLRSEGYEIAPIDQDTVPVQHVQYYDAED